MLVAGSRPCCSLYPREERTLSEMAKDRRRPCTVPDKNEFSGEESPEDAHLKRFERDVTRSGSRSGVWGYSYQRNYAPELYNLAWARAVQDVPLGMDLCRKEEGEARKDEDVNSNTAAAAAEIHGGGEKEEGELEEGEIDFDSATAAEIETETEIETNQSEEVVEVENAMEEEEDGEEESEDFDRQVGLILEELEAVTEEQVEKSFEDVCSRLRKSFESLKPMVLDTHVPPVISALVQQAFMGIQTMHNVVCSGSMKTVELNKNLLLRLLIHLKNQYHILLTSDQLREIDDMVKSLVFVNGSKEKEVNASKVAEKYVVSTEMPCIDPRTSTAGRTKLRISLIPKRRPEYSPLLDLHADYDENSLPSPTREHLSPSPIHGLIGVDKAAGVLSQPVIPLVGIETAEQPLHLYVADPFKAVSSYQQKYGQAPVFSSNQLPSPTPSEESNDSNDTDLQGEVSSSNCNTRVIKSLNRHQLTGSSIGATVPTSRSQSSVTAISSLATLPSLTKSPAKSRDPRLRFIHSDVGSAASTNKLPTSVNYEPVGEAVISRKHRDIDGPSQDDCASKRQRRNFVFSGNVPVASGKGGWLVDNNSVNYQSNCKPHLNGNGVEQGDGESVLVNPEKKGIPNANSVSVGGQNLNNGASSAYPSSHFMSLKDIGAVNPTMLVQLIKQKLAADAHHKTASSTDGLPGVAALLAAASMKSETGQSQSEKSQLPDQSACLGSQNDVGKIRMKPRDPRRALHNYMTLTENSGIDQINAKGSFILDPQSGKGSIISCDPGEQTHMSDFATMPDTSQQSTNNTKGHTDITSSSLFTSRPAFTSLCSSQSLSSGPNKADDIHTTAEVGTSCAQQAPNPWGDVNHLLDGYDDQQKAAFQRERARRIEEQNRMFAARKLCLVLDLDHTLLNSAKFTEVDPFHDEMLRKKEELDREMPQRHLFRFPYMGMWTKLRPGIWNFLEKASKLYELHVYTMGNKLYATEMAKILDPTGVLFAGRILSRGDDDDSLDGDDRVPKIKDLDGVLGMESAVVIIDDSVKVWPHNKLNLIVVERYIYFPCSRRQFGLAGPSLLEIDHDERPENGTLASSLGVIERIHRFFFSHRSLNDVDVRNILAAEQRKILSGCKIVFSRIFPVGEVNPHHHPLWQTAEQFGAMCTIQIDEQVTHVVANSLGTDKVNWALSTGRYVVRPGWVEASALLYQRASEKDFSV